MTLKNTPPKSPAQLSPVNMNDVPFNQQNAFEIIEDDEIPEVEPASGSDGDLNEGGSNEENPNEDNANQEDQSNDDMNVEGNLTEDSLSEEEIVPERDDADFVFTKHGGGVLCCAFHPKRVNIVATGGMDDTVIVWDVNNGDILLHGRSHEESVEVVEFSHDGKYLASSDLSGRIKVWNTENYTIHRQFELEDELGWTLWHHGSNVLISSSQKGLIYMYKVSNGEQKMIMTPFGSTSMCGKVFPDGKRLVCGYSEGHIKIIDMRQASVLSSIKVRDENVTISCLDVHRDNNLVICGCNNGDVILVSSQAGKILAILRSGRDSDLCNYIEAIEFCKDASYPVAASGSLDGNLIIWDIATQTVRHRACFSSSINHLVWHPVLPIVYTSHTDGIVNKYDSKSGRVLKELMGHTKCIYSIVMSPDGKTLVTTSEDKTARAYRDEGEEEDEGVEEVEEVDDDIEVEEVEVEEIDIDEADLDEVEDDEVDVDEADIDEADVDEVDVDEADLDEVEDEEDGEEDENVED